MSSSKFALSRALAPPPGAPTLVREALEQGTNFWIGDDALADPHAVRARLLAHPRWNLGYPHRAETWPGMRFPDALASDELARVEAWVRSATGCARLWVATAPGGARLDCNVAQLVGAGESGPRPHTDRRDLCRYAAVIYLTPQAPAAAGTSFYRLRYANGALGGNACPPPHDNLVQALRVKGLPPGAWVEETRVENVFNRIVLYKAALVHSATGYFGQAMDDKRLTVAFFWMAE
jgi:Family of unknown function (DUF6445)